VIRDSLLGITTRYRLDSRFRFTAEVHSIKTGSGVHQASYPTVTKGSFPTDKTARTWRWPLIYIQYRGQEWWSYNFTPAFVFKVWCLIILLIRIVGGGVQLGPLGTAVTDWPIVLAPCNYDDGEFRGMKNGKGNQSTRRKPPPAPLCPPQIPLDHTRDRTRAAAIGSQRPTAWATVRPTGA
jgi:hypothetical protein